MNDSERKLRLLLIAVMRVRACDMSGFFDGVNVEARAALNALAEAFDAKRARTRCLKLSGGKERG